MVEHDAHTAATALMQSPQFWESVANSIPDLLVLVGRHGDILFANHVPPHVTDGDVVGTSVFEFVPQASRDTLRESLAEIFAGAPPRRREQEGVLANGSSAWYSTHTSPVVHDGRIVAAVIVARDITQRRRAQLALAESEARFRTLVENAPEAIVVYDMDDDRFMDANRNACELFELQLSEMLHTSPAMVSPQYQPDGRESSELARVYLTDALNGRVFSFEWVHLTASGRERRCEVRLVRLPSERRLVRGSIIDRTERIRMDEQMAEWQKMDALGQLAAGIAHDFNNVLTVVGATAEVIVQSPGLPKETIEDAQAIVTEADRGAALAGQLLAFSRRQTLPADPLSLNELVHSIAFALRRVIPPRIEIVEELQESPLIVTIHRSQAEQILVNLVLNARDAIVGKGAITISTECERGYARLCVRDTGQGMSEETRKRSLEPFFTTKPAGQGTGLGLSTVNSIVQKAGGCIVIESRPGRGTSVSIALPSTSCENIRGREESPG